MTNMLYIGYEPRRDTDLGVVKLIKDLNGGRFFRSGESVLTLRHETVEPLAIGDLIPVTEDSKDWREFDAEGNLVRIHTIREKPKACDLTDDRPDHVKAFLQRNYRPQVGFGYGIDQAFLKEMREFNQRDLPKTRHHPWIEEVRGMIRNYALERNPRPFVAVEIVEGEVPDHVYEGIARVCEKRYRKQTGSIFDSSVVIGSFRYEIKPVERSGK